MRVPKNTKTRPLDVEIAAAKIAVICKEYGCTIENPEGWGRCFLQDTHTGDTAHFPE